MAAGNLTYPSSFSSWQHYEQCFALPPPSEQVECSSQILNVTQPPSVYSYDSYTSLWQPVLCMLSNVSLANRVDIEDSMNYCTVPLRGSDAILFVFLGLLIPTVLFGKLTAVWALVSGGVLGVANYYLNLQHFSNSVSIWLSIQPADLFFYIFLPPLLVEETLRIDLFLFRKVWVHVIFLAYVLVGISVIALTPIILYVLGFHSRGWSWVHGAIFSSIIAPTDTVAVAAILSAANGPAKLTTLVKGESVFNDASGITLFNIFAQLIAANAAPSAATTWPSVWSTLPGLLRDVVKVSAIGAAIGLAMSWATGHLLRWLRWRGARPYIETTLVLAVAYLSYYVANQPAKASGVMAVVLFGLYGNATSKWGMLSTSEDSGAFDAVWDLVAFAINGLVFFWSGVASVNFFIRSAGLLTRTAVSFVAIPVIWVSMLVIRTGCLVLLNPVFKLLGQKLTPAEIAFSGWASMRGSVSLIMASVFAIGNPSFITGSDTDADSSAVDIAKAINAEILLWTSSFVLLTLVVNGPICGPMLRLLRLDSVSKARFHSRARAKRALSEFTGQKVAALKASQNDEFLAGADWSLVAEYVQVTAEGFDEAPPKPAASATIDVNIKTTLGVVKTLWRGALRGTRQWAASLRWKFWQRRRQEQLAAVDASTSQSFTVLSASSGEGSGGVSQKQQQQYEGKGGAGQWGEIDADWAQDRVECPYLHVRQNETDGEAGTEGKLQAAVHLTSDSNGVVDLERGESAEAAGAIELQQLEGGGSSAAARGSSLRQLAPGVRSSGSSASLVSISETETLAAEHSVRGAAGAALLNELRSSLGSQARGSTLRSSGSSSRPSFGTTSSMPAAVGRTVQAQLQTELRQHAADAGQEPESWEEEAGPSAGATATVSGASGKRLAAELKQMLTRVIAERSSSAAASPGRDLLGRRRANSVLLAPSDEESPRDGRFPAAANVPRRASGMAPVAAALHIRRTSALEKPRGDFPGGLVPLTLPSDGFSSDADGTPTTDATPSSVFDFEGKNGRLGSRFGPAAAGGKLDVPPSEPSLPSEEIVLEEVRRAVAGLKRHFAARRGAGMLSTRGLRILDYSCDEVMEREPSTLRLWPIIEAEIRGGWAARAASRLSLATLRAYRGLPSFLRGAFSWPFKKVSAGLRRFLGRRMLVGCEVAVELYLALGSNNVPQIRWLKREEHAGAWRALLDDIEADSAAAHRFIIEREIEAPDLFTAIQSYRAAMAVLRQQLRFTGELFQAGAVDEAEEEALSDPIDRKVRHLELVGPVWQPPRPKAVLRSLPFMATLPDAAFRKVYAAGAILGCRKGQPIWSGEPRAGLFVVLSGVVRRVLTKNGAPVKEYFQGPGGVVGELLCLTGTFLPGVAELALAEGNALGRGPVVFHLPQAAVEQLLRGGVEFAALEDALLRLSAVFVVENAKMLGQAVEVDEERARAALQGRVVRLRHGQSFESPSAGSNAHVVLLAGSLRNSDGARVTAPYVLAPADGQRKASVLLPGVWRAEEGATVVV